MSSPLKVYNKIDQISMEEVDRLARKPNSVVISCGMKLNLDYLLEMLWEYLALTCIYTKKRGQRPDFTDAIILRKGASVEHVCHRIHLSLASQFKYALVWCHRIHLSLASQFKYALVWGTST
ncbi:developmentally-regulated GTP-binding protein 2-like isoform X2 [Aotus nancymaae]|uniref:developmentally-regulated GTP-binding protein 2-like isoform X2 n=1 Tax=Aotus nancymaae TaxID=37293 RepID=UPI0030FE393D